MKEDVINIEILEDGTIRSTTPKVSAANHSNANTFFKLLAQLTGGAVDIKKRDKSTDTQNHSHQHQ